MAENKIDKNNTGTNDGLALIIGGLFVLALVFATYSYFNRSNTNSEDTTKETTMDDAALKNDDNESLGERLKELFDNEEEKEGDLNGEGVATNNSDENDNDTVKEVVPDTDTPQAADTWTANNYSQGEISGNSYVVKSGDTLWEIAEAKYGNGADWTKILEANMSSIRTLPNGQQALIVTGQTLVLP